MERSQKHFLSSQFAAPNVVEIDVPPEVLAPFGRLLPEIEAIEEPNREYTLATGERIWAAGPREWGSDILWLSANDERTFALFEQAYRALDPARYVHQYIERDADLTFYMGQLVTRRRCDKAKFHVDWDGANNDAFTFLAPLDERGAQTRLLYHDVRGAERSYSYRVGKGLLFGDWFSHSTAPLAAESRSTLLCFNFGTDRMDNWSDIARTTARQGQLCRRPDGQLVRRGEASGAARSTAVPT